MDIIEEKFPHYDPAGQEMVRKAYEIASRALAEDKRSDGSPFIGHPMGVALNVWEAPLVKVPFHRVAHGSGRARRVWRGRNGLGD